ncbi:F-box-like protein [Medicago truncatula]|uniref:F-box-like protein n=1 Tax=Medicago truncatula TaxID=3880 RepID=A0A072VQF6_MEDTR|nr:F-box-like protein [Medicago truncatula]
MSTPLERYQKLSLTESLPKSYRYPIACKELSFILREAFHKFPKNLQTIIFQDTLSAFRLLPQMETQSAVSAVHLLFQSVEAALPKQKKNMAVTEFKQAMIAHKRRSKAHQVEKGSLQLPEDILVQIFSLLDMRSLVSAGIVSRSWNMAANDNCLWESQYAVLYGDAAKQRPMGPDEDRNDKLLQKPQDTKMITDWKKAVKGAYTGALSRKLAINRGYCECCKTIVWLNNSRCPNVHGGMISEIHDIEPVTSTATTTTKPYPTKWGRLHGSNYAIVFYHKPNLDIEHVTSFQVYFVFYLAILYYHSFFYFGRCNRGGPEQGRVWQ